MRNPVSTRPGCLAVVLHHALPLSVQRAAADFHCFVSCGCFPSRLAAQLLHALIMPAYPHGSLTSVLQRTCHR